MVCCRANVSRAEVDMGLGSGDVASGSSDSVCGTPRQVAISRCRARRWPSLKFNVVRSTSVMSTTVSQLRNPFSNSIERYVERPMRSRTSLNSGIVNVEGEGIAIIAG